MLRDFFNRHYHHFNARSLRRAAEALRVHVDQGGAVVVAMGGALSTAWMGTSLARLIRAGKVHAISCTGANLEEDFYSAAGRSTYVDVDFRSLSPEEETRIANGGLRRVTDTCIPDAVMNQVGACMAEVWRRADAERRRAFPHEFLYEAIHAQRGRLECVESSWVLAAADQGLPIFVPGWEDSTLGNMYAALVRAGRIANVHTVRTGVEYMLALADWYAETATRRPVGLVQLGGGIAGDFVICVAPMLREDVRTDVPVWGYFCQIGDSTTSYGSYSGAPPNEKISWGKVLTDTPRFQIESDATIVAPLLFEYLLESEAPTS